MGHGDHSILRVLQGIIIMIRFHTLFIFLTVALIGCAAPGTPLIRTTQHDGEGPLIAGCKNVSNKAWVEIFKKDSYLTTWGSAWKEGAIEGIQMVADEDKMSPGGNLVGKLVDIGLDKEEMRARLQSSPESTWVEKINRYPSKNIPFCRKYSAKSSTIFSIAADVLSTLDYQITRTDESLGILETEFVERRHPAARWRDRYVIYIDPNPDEVDHSIVRIFRTIYIDRSGNTFNEADSVGYNETWIMTRITDLLENKK